MKVLQNLARIFGVPDLRRKIVFTAVLILIFRLVAHIPASGVDRAELARLFAQSPFLSLLDIFSGGTLANFSILALGINPYINASIIMQLMTLVSPQLEELSKEGDQGRAKINQYTRFMTVPLACIQAVGMYVLLRSQGIIAFGSVVDIAALVITMTAGTIFVMWLGELITEHGIGNGISLLIFAGIVGRMPVLAGKTFTTLTPEDVFPFATFFAVGLLVILGVVIINEATRRIPVQYARRGSHGGLVSQGTHLPMRINQAGVIPIIFAVSLVLAPSMIGQFLANNPNPALSRFGQTLTHAFTPSNPIYTLVYFGLVLGFTFFYTAIVFNPTKIADEIKKVGGFIPGIRPGSATSEYLSFVLTRITLPGGIFLGAIAVLPSVIQGFTGIKALAIGGTGLLIVVSVVLETVRKMEAQLVTRNYDKFVQ